MGHKAVPGQFFSDSSLYRPIITKRFILAMDHPIAPRTVYQFNNFLRSLPVPGNDIIFIYSKVDLEQFTNRRLPSLLLFSVPCLPYKSLG